MISLFIQPASLGGVSSPRHRRSEVLRDGQIGEDLLASGHQHDTAAGDLVRRPVLDPGAVKGDCALGHARIVDAEKAGNRA